MNIFAVNLSKGVKSVHSLLGIALARAVAFCFAKQGGLNDNNFLFINLWGGGDIP